MGKRKNEWQDIADQGARTEQGASPVPDKRNRSPQTNPGEIAVRNISLTSIPQVGLELQRVLEIQTRSVSDL